MIKLKQKLEQALPKEVMHEIEGIIKYVPFENRQKLNFCMLEPGDSWYCIYGQMYGSCWNERVKELLLKIQPKLYNIEEEEKTQFNTKLRHMNNKHITMLENFIIQTPKHNKDIIKYLKKK